MIAGVKKGEPGFCFKDDALLIFRTDEVLRIRGWPDPDCVRKRHIEGYWQGYYPDFILVRPYRRPSKKTRNPDQLTLAFEMGPRRLSLPEQRKRAFDQFRFSMPREVARGLEPFHHAQWDLLNLLHDLPDALDLLNSNPALAFCVALNPQLVNRRAATAAEGAQPIIHKKQKEIAGWLGFPRTAQAVKVLRKTAPGGLELTTLRRLRGALAMPEAAKVLGHVKRVNLSIIEIATQPALLARVTPAFLEELAAEKRDDYYPHIACMLRECIELFRDLYPEAAPRIYRNMTRLRIDHRNLGMAYVQRHHRELLKYNFPRPPVMGANGIRPIRTVQDLVEEGEQQSNCVACYAKRIADRQTFIYRITYPERATLSLEKHHARWQPGDLLAAKNRPAQPATRKYVEEWLSRNGRLV